MTEKVKVETIVFCPYCLKRMQNGFDPELYMHETRNVDCPLRIVEMNGKQEVVMLHYDDYGKIFSIKP